MEELTLDERLVAVQNALKVTKDKYNVFGKYSFRNQEAILEAVKPLLLEHSLRLSLSDRIELIGDRYYIVASATLKYKEEELIVEARAREDLTQAGMAASQVTGSTSSYARKYCLGGLFLLDDNKDPDEDDKVNKPKTLAPTQPKAPVRTPAQPVAKTPVKVEAAKTEAAKEEVKAETPKDDSADRAKALTAFQALDEAKVLAHLIGTEKILKYVKLEDYVNKEPLDDIRAVYAKVLKTCKKN